MACAWLLHPEPRGRAGAPRICKELERGPNVFNGLFSLKLHLAILIVAEGSLYMTVKGDRSALSG